MLEGQNMAAPLTNQYMIALPYLISPYFAISAQQRRKSALKGVWVTIA